MKNLTLTVIALVLLGIASLGFTLIKNQTQQKVKKEVILSKDNMITDMSKADQQNGSKEGNELASFD